MAIDSLGVFKSTFADLPKVSDASWASNMAAWVNDRVTNKTVLSGGGGTVPIFTLNQAVLQAGLSSMSASTDQAASINLLANAFQSALTASTMVVATGFYFGSPSPTTTFSEVTTSLIDPASVLLAKAKILELIGAPNVSDPNDSLFPEKIRDCILALTVTTIGFDSTPPPTGPLPLTDALRSVI